MGTSLFTSLLPALTAPLADVVKALSRRWIGMSVDDEIKLMSAQNEKLKALAELDKPSETISPWVANLRASFRYICAGIIVIVASVLCVYALAKYQDLRSPIIMAFIELTAAVFSFIFGERLYLKLKN